MSVSSSNSSRSSRHRHSQLSVNSDVTPNLVRSYQPVPPLKTQLNSLNDTCQNILSIVKKANDIPSFLNEASNFNENLIKFLNDLIRCFTAAYRRQNPSKDDILAITDSIYQYFSKIKEIFISLRKFQSKNLLNYLDQIDRLQMLVEFWSFVEDNEAIFINEIWHYCSEVYIRTEQDRNDDENNDEQLNDVPYKEAYSFFTDRLNDHYNQLNELQLKFINGVNQYDLSRGYQDEEEEDEEEEEDAIEEEEDMGQTINKRKQRKMEREFRQKVGDAIRRSYSLVFPTLKEYWKNEFDWELKKVQKRLDNEREQLSDDQLDYSVDLECDVALEDNIIYKLYDQRLSQIETFYKMIEELQTSNSTLLIKFITKEASLAFDDQIACLRDLWEFSSQIASREFCEYEMTHFGSIIVDNLKSEAKFNLTPKSLNRLSDVFEQAENIEDLQTAQEVINLIIQSLNQKIDELKESYEGELQFFREDVDSNYLSKYVKRQHNSSKKIDELAMNIAESIKKSEAAAFVHQKLDPDVDIYRSNTNDKDEPEYPMKKELQELTHIAPNFYITITKHIGNLNKELDEIYTKLDKEIKTVDDSASVQSGKTYSNMENENDAMSNYHNKIQKKMEIRARNKQANDSLSVYAPSTKSANLHLNTRKKKGQSKADYQKFLTEKKKYRISIELIQEAICRTYEEFFASIRVLIINAVRYTSSEIADEYNKELEKKFKNYLSHLNVLKKWYIQEMKVEKVEAIEARMATNQGVSKQMINECIKESLREKTLQYINYYIDLNENYDDDFDAEVQNLDEVLFKKMEDIKSTVHIKQLEIIERQYRIEMMKEKNRDPAQITEGEKKVRTLLASKQYDDARKEKDKLAKLRVSLWNEKQKEIQKKYRKIRHEKLEQQARDLELLEQSYQKKRTLLEKDYNLNKENSRKALRASLRNQIDFHVKLAAKLNLSGNPNKVESQKALNSNNMSLTKSYEAVTNSVLFDKKIEL